MSTLFKHKSSTGSVTSNRRELWRNFDWVLIVAVALLLTMGTAMIRSSTFEHPTLYDTPRQQIQYAIVGFALIWMLASIDYRYWQSLSKFLYVLIIIALLALFVLGVVAGGAQRWFDFFGLFNIQPSELAKIGSVIWIASFFAHRRNQLNQFRWIMLSIIHAGIPAALVMAQPDLSSAVMIIVVWLSILWTAGVRPQHLAILSGDNYMQASVRDEVK